MAWPISSSVSLSRWPLNMSSRSRWRESQRLNAYSLREQIVYYAESIRKVVSQAADIISRAAPLSINSTRRLCPCLAISIPSLTNLPSKSRPETLFMI
jgi:hypothetical protein